MLYGTKTLPKSAFDRKLLEDRDEPEVPENGNDTNNNDEDNTIDDDDKEEDEE